MGNRNYIKGRQKEYSVMRMLEATGFNCIRASGSHGIFDVIAFGLGQVRMIQVKADCTMDDVEIEIAQNIKVPIGVTKELWIFTKGNRTPNIRIL